MNDGSAINRIAELALEGAKISVNSEGEEFSGVKLYRLPEKPLHEIDSLTVATLRSFAEYVKDQLMTDAGNGNGEDCFALVRAGGVTVNLYGPAHPDHRTREHFLTAVALAEFDDKIGQVLMLEEFNLWLRSSFEQTDDRDLILKILGSVKSEEIRQESDDGFAQNITVRDGVALVTDTQVPSEVTLTPRRIFPEVDQPEQRFVVRLSKSGRNEDAYIAARLVDADGGKWKLAGSKAVGEWLVKEIGPNLTILW